MKQGFTLAEMLLTLAIIGVIAALTIPAVITKITKDQYVVALKKAFNTLKAVEREAIQEHGEMKNWTWNVNSSDFDKYFKPHFDILKDCGSSTDDGCFAAEYTLIKSNDPVPNFSPNNSGVAKFITSDGITFAYKPDDNAGTLKGIFFVDINGKKNPNKWGKDLFAFVVFPDLGIRPDGSYDRTGAVISGNVADNQCSTDGYYCTAKVLAEGAMNY